MKLNNIYIAMAGAFVGALFSIILTMHHVDPNFENVIFSTVCGEAAKSGCNVVNKSGASVLFGLPVALWGFMYYGALLGLLFFYRATKERSFVQLIFWLAAAGGVVDIGLLLYSVAALHTVCTICAFTYAATFVILGTSWFHIKKQNLGLSLNLAGIFDVKLGLTAPALLLALLVPVSGAFVYAAADGGKAPSSGNYIYHLKMAVNSYYSEYNAKQSVMINNEGTPKKGPERGVLNITEFADFLCPACKMAYQVLSGLHKKYPNEVSVTYRHYPLDTNCNSGLGRQIHDGACLLSYASYCAGKQGKFWEIHDRIFESQENLSAAGKVTEKDVLSLARTASLNMGAFSGCLNSEEAKQAIARDIEEGNRLKVTSTPSVFINGKKQEGVPIEFLVEQLLFLEKKKMGAQ